MCVFCEFCKFFKDTFFTEQLQLTASDIRMQVAVLYSLSLSLQYLIINLTFSFL